MLRIVANNNRLDYLYPCVIDVNENISKEHNIKIISTKVGQGLVGVKQLSFEDKLSTIEMSAFENCSDLVILQTNTAQNNDNEDNLSIQVRAFRGCSALTTLIFNGKYKRVVIERDAFSYCSSLRTIEIDFEEIEIHEGAFDGCNDVTFVINKSNASFDSFCREHDNIRCISK